MESSEAAHKLAVQHRVEAAVRAGFTKINEVLLRCDGADPKLVEELLSAALQPSIRPIGAAKMAREVLAIRPPAADPLTSQWWFSAVGLKRLSALVDRSAILLDNPKILCLGAPCLSPHVAYSNGQVQVLEFDTDVCARVQNADPQIKVSEYDVADELPPDLRGHFDICITDPPWYSEFFYAFVNRCLSALRLGGELFITFPGALTRPEVPKQRTELLSELVRAGHEILSLEAGAIQYRVPRFEEAALSSVKGFSAFPWRQADLLHIRKSSENFLPAQGLAKKVRTSYSRNSDEFRIFLSDKATGISNVLLQSLADFSGSISRRGLLGADPDLWSTEKAGARIGNLPGNLDLVRGALQCWAENKSIKETATALSKNHFPALAKEAVSQLDTLFGLWSRFAAAQPLKTEEDLEALRRKLLSPIAAKPSEREHPEGQDYYRREFQRDRDRILWSPSLRKLSHKTQLFPAQHDDDLRQRLTHSIEVLQLGTTIGNSFSLDNDLIEAGALAHDIGHTPFGHAGEHALNKLFNHLNKALGGFNHYEHGVDVIRFLEGPYHVSSATQFSGLNLTPELCECVIKHTFCQSDEDDEFSASEVLKRSKHADKNFIPAGYCHLEGQAVRAADKISYLISDLEDGIRLGILTAEDLLSCRFFHRSPLTFEPGPEGSLAVQFASQRRWVLKILMEDILEASNRRIARISKDGLEAIRRADTYMIQYSPEMSADVGEIWQNLQARKLHQDQRVVQANMHSARVIRDLVVAYSAVPELIEERFRNEYERLNNSSYMKFYEARAGREITLEPELLRIVPMHVMIGKNCELKQSLKIHTRNLIMAKDYVASLSDARARQLHASCFVQG